MPTVFRTESERPLIAANSPRCRRQRWLRAEWSARGWSCPFPSPAAGRFPRSNSIRTATAALRGYSNIACYYRYDLLSSRNFCGGVPMKDDSILPTQTMIHRDRCFTTHRECWSVVARPPSCRFFAETGGMEGRRPLGKAWAVASATLQEGVEVGIDLKANRAGEAGDRWRRPVHPIHRRTRPRRVNPGIYRVRQTRGWRFGSLPAASLRGGQPSLLALPMKAPKHMILLYFIGKSSVKAIFLPELRELEKAVGVDVDLDAGRAGDADAGEPIAQYRLEPRLARGFDEKPLAVAAAQDGERRRSRAEHRDPGGLRGRAGV